MAVRAGDPWGDKSSFENLTQKAGGLVKKTVSGTVKAVVADIKDQTGIETNTGNQQTSQANQITPGSPVKQEDQAKIDQEKQKNINETRSNLQKMEQEIVRVRQERLKKQQEMRKAEAEKKQEKKQEEQKKNAEPFWKRFMRKGSHEGLKKMGA